MDLDKKVTFVAIKPKPTNSTKDFEPAEEETKIEEAESLKIKIEINDDVMINKGDKDPIEIRPCPMCDKGFPSGDLLSKHFRVHREPSIVRCRRCSDRFETEGEKTATDSLKDHLKLCKQKMTKKPMAKLKKVVNESAFKCPICRRGFLTQEPLDIHLENHENGLLDPRSCDDCRKEFITDEKYSAKVHLKMHLDQGCKGMPPQSKESAEIGNTCQKCSKTFQFPYILRRHLLNGRCLGERKSKIKQTEFPCDMCKKVFKRKHCLKRHNCIKDLTCQNCNEVFKFKNGLNNHRCPYSPFLTG